MDKHPINWRAKLPMKGIGGAALCITSTEGALVTLAAGTPALGGFSDGSFTVPADYN